MHARESAPNPLPASRPVASLRLDPDNPRLAAALPRATQADLLRELHRAHDLQPLLRSLSQHGFFDGEPLLGVADTGARTGAGIVVVVDGNRRLAALRLLLDAAARRIVGIDTDPDLPAAGVLRTLDPVPVLLYARRADLVPHQGVRHIRGALDWEPLAKARHVRRLAAQGRDPADIACAVGVQGGTVRHWLLALHVLEQANAESETPWDEAGFKFSWLLTALHYAPVRAYLQLEDPQGGTPPRPANASRLREFMHDLYGPPPGDSQRAKVRDSRELRTLAAVYAHPEACAVLRAGGALAEAHARLPARPDARPARLR